MGLLTLASVVRAGDLFGSLEREEERTPERKFEVKANSRLEELIEIFGKVKGHDNYDIYDEYVKLTPDNYTSNEIEQISLLISDDNKYNFNFRYSLFLSSLINKSSDKEITIHTSQLENPPYDIGFMNNGKIINVNGNVGSFLGYCMMGGKIIVNGNAKNEVGFCMNGGEIHLNGNYECLSHCIEGGNIYHKGVQIIKDGKAVPGAKIKWAS